MKAATYHRYGSPDVLSIREVPTPAPGPDEVLISVHAASVTTADWRLRASAFPGILWLAGRLMTGLWAPRTKVLGSDIAGKVVAVGQAVTRFRPGDRVYGAIRAGGHAEYAVVSQTAALVPVPDGLSNAGAAALPFGALTALNFLRDVARVGPGQRVLIVGASGGVGAYATQIAKVMGAHVTAVAGPGRAALLRGLGADEVLDYRQQDPADTPDPFDVVFDTVGATTWAGMRRAIRKTGLFLPLNFGGTDMLQAVWARVSGGPRLQLFVSGETAEDLTTISGMIRDGSLRPVIDSTYALTQIREAHSHVERRHRAGAVLLDVAGPASARSAA